MPTCSTQIGLCVPTDDDANDGVQYARSHRRWYMWDGSVGRYDPSVMYKKWNNDEDKYDPLPYWLPPLYPWAWTVWFAPELGDVAIALKRPLVTNSKEDWQPIDVGSFKDMWPLFMRYVALTWLSAEGKD